MTTAAGRHLFPFFSPELFSRFAEVSDRSDLQCRRTRLPRHPLPDTVARSPVSFANVAYRPKSDLSRHLFGSTEILVRITNIFEVDFLTCQRCGAPPSDRPRTLLRNIHLSICNDFISCITTPSLSCRSCF